MVIVVAMVIVVVMVVVVGVQELLRAAVVVCGGTQLHVSIAWSQLQLGHQSRRSIHLSLQGVPWGEGVHFHNRAQ